MAEVKAPNKVVVLMCPHALDNKFKLLEFINIEKSALSINYKISSLDSNTLSKNYSHLPASIKELLLLFSPDAIILMQQKLREPFAKQKAALFREVHSLHCC